MGKIIIKRVFSCIGVALKMKCYIDNIEVCRLGIDEQFIYNTENDLCIFKCTLGLGNPWSKEYSIDFNNGNVVSINVKQELWKPKAELEYRDKPKAPITSEIKKETNSSNVDEILRYKNLLNLGIITQEEFEKSKRKILGMEKKKVESLKCPNCGATYIEGQTKCEYCNSYLTVVE